MSQQMKHHKTTGATVHWENTADQEEEDQKDDFSWNKERSTSISEYPGIDCGNSWMHSPAYDDFSSTILQRHRRSSVLVGKRSMQLLEESGEEEPKQRNDLEGYSPFEARSRIEYNRYLNFFSRNGLAISTYLYITAKDGNSMLRPNHLNDTIENAYMVQKWNLDSGDPPNPYLRLKYPISTLFGREINIQPYFFGVELYNETETKEEIDEETESLRQLFGNDTNIELLIGLNETYPPITNMKSVKMISLQLRALENPQWSKDEMKQWEMNVVHFFENYQSEYLTVYVISTTYIEEEMVRAGISLLPYLTAGFIIMCTCSVITVMVRAAYMHQNNIFKVFLAVMACATPLLACSTALAILFLCGMRFSSILCVIPFLVLSIGIDSSYLMIHEWQRVTKEIRDSEKKGGTVGHRMSEVLSEVGPAILISAITNILADAVGCFTSSPEIRLLCIGNLFSMFVAYLYQRKNSRFHDKSKLYISKYMRVYVNIIAHPVTATLIIVLYITYLIITIWGITRMNISLTPQKLFAADSPLIKLDKLRAEYQVPVFTMASVFVETPGDLSQRLPLLLMNNMVQDFENLNGSWGPTGTMYFVRDFALFQNFLRSDHDYDVDVLDDVSTTTVDPDDVLRFNNDILADFLALPEYDFWSGFVQLQNLSTDGKKKKLKRFFFTTGYHDENLKEWLARGKLLKQWRAIVDKAIYESFHASVYHEDAIFLDLIDNMPTDTWQSIAGTLVCMAATAFIYYKRFYCMLTVAGILGILSWWNVELDPISMAAMIISTGFSVDIPAHVAYHYCKASEESTSQARLGNCLTSVGFPAVQAALSTILCVFVKTMVTSVVLCNLHGLVILPAILSIVHRVRGRLDDSKIYSTPAERAVNKRLKQIKKRMAKTTEIQRRNGHQLDLKMDRPAIPEFSVS
uniref:SSD domain-containing protein n=1 Tax=Loa loa TaxID=7209 RepID=A0A1I7VZV9_LOALO